MRWDLFNVSVFCFLEVVRMGESLLGHKRENRAGRNLQAGLKSLISKLWSGMKKTVSANTMMLLYLWINLTVGKKVVSKPIWTVPF